MAPYDMWSPALPSRSTREPKTVGISLVACHHGAVIDWSIGHNPDVLAVFRGHAEAGVFVQP